MGVERKIWVNTCVGDVAMMMLQVSIVIGRNNLWGERRHFSDWIIVNLRGGFFLIGHIYIDNRCVIYILELFTKSKNCVCNVCLYLVYMISSISFI